LICMRVAFNEAASLGLLCKNEPEVLLKAATGLHYRERTYSRVIQESDLPRDRRERVLNFVLHQATDQKAEDARCVLRLVACGGQRTFPTARDLPQRPGPPRPMVAVRDLLPAVKFKAKDSVRTVPEEVTERNLAAVRSLVGITRVTDITGLDVL